MTYNIYKNEQPFTLESGYTLPFHHLAYTTHGILNKEKNNVVWIFHALTANSDAAEWWPGLVGNEKIFSPEKYFIICVNMPGSCYGSTGPLDPDPVKGKVYYHAFPFFTTRDMVRSYAHLKKFLGIQKIKIGIGGSMGGQQLLEWAIEDPGLFENIFPLATNARHSPWAIAFNASQRMSIETDPTWKEDKPLAGIEGMKVARSIALISYRHYETYQAAQTEETNETIYDFKTVSYQRYQGDKLAKRFNAFSYYFLSKSMDSHNVGRGRGSMEAALSHIKAKTLVIGIVSDILFPLKEQEFIASNITGAKFRSIQSTYGHDGFLLEYERIENLITEFLNVPAVLDRTLQI
ncbi:MAG: homoserine O-acetyltransferase [Chitinophagaceae bacterium]|nr:homoserine O-acetyltransferase [Chitinophagaceae bacterium]HEV8082882.1 homoserine O-acetyltransferase [Chitinophagaceae bacterium]